MLSSYSQHTSLSIMTSIFIGKKVEMIPVSACPEVRTLHVNSNFISNVNVKVNLNDFEISE